MKRPVVYCLAFCAAAASQPAIGKSILLQTVEIDGMSTDGGEAKLYRATKAALAQCRIDVIHHGESGKVGYVFTFGPALLSATRTDYEYNEPYYMPGGGRVASKHSMTLQSVRGRKQLTADFAEYKGMFDAHKLARCNTR